MRVLAPDGKELPWYARQLAAVNGAAEFSLPFALNDPPGAYTVFARDVATGTTARHEVMLP